MLKLTDHKANGDVKNKMDGMTSINTPVLSNEFCQSMSKTDAICKSCYARVIAKRFPNTERAYQVNADLLTDPNYTPEFINRSVVRIHAVGELIDTVHFQNIIRLANFNPATRFVLWTKRATIVNAVLAVEDKPVNLHLIYSSPVVNSASPLPRWFDKVFTVYSKKYVGENSVVINCQKQCKDCMLCYTDNEVVHISEELK